MRLIRSGRRRARAAEALRADADYQYKRFVRAFGSAGNLSDTQLAALADYWSDLVGQDRDLTVLELLLGREWTPADQPRSAGHALPASGRSPTR